MQALIWDYLFNISKSGGFTNWQLGKAQAYSRDAMAPTINWDPSSETWRGIIQCCLLFGDPALAIKPSGPFEDYDMVVSSLNVPTYNAHGDTIDVEAMILNFGFINHRNGR